MGHDYSEAALASSVVNGRSIADKVEFCQSLFGKEVSVSSVFNKDEMIDVTSCTRGHGYQGSYPLGCTRLPKKTHRGLRKDVCTGTWHPARVQWQVRRAGQFDFHHRDVQHEQHGGERGDQEACQKMEGAF